MDVLQFIILYLNKIYNYLYYDQYIYICNIVIRLDKINLLSNCKSY